MSKKITAFLKRDTILIVAVLLALVSAFFIRPDREYLDYIDFRTIGLLFSLMTVTEGLKKSGVFDAAADCLINGASTVFQLSALLVFLCFLSSMFITNDVALITFVPLTITILNKLDGKRNNKLLIPIVVLQTVAANLGSMFTPVGNPQNLYLFGISELSIGKFLLLMLPYTLAGAIMLAVWLVFVCGKNKKISGFAVRNGNSLKIGHKKLMVYGVLFLLCLLTVAKLMRWEVTAAIILAVSFIGDREILKKIDYSLLLTFCGLFVFIGNIGRIGFFGSLIGEAVKNRETVTAVVVSQMISNVPCAVLLSRFTDNINALIVGTNIGGLGTLIASMASLISYKQIVRIAPEKKAGYFGYFTLANAAFLAVMLVLAAFIGM